MKNKNALWTDEELRTKITDFLYWSDVNFTLNVNVASRYKIWFRDSNRNGIGYYDKEVLDLWLKETQCKED